MDDKYFESDDRIISRINNSPSGEYSFNLCGSLTVKLTFCSVVTETMSPQLFPVVQYFSNFAYEAALKSSFELTEVIDI